MATDSLVGLELSFEYDQRKSALREMFNLVKAQMHAYNGLLCVP